MGSREPDPDRYLFERGGAFQYHRKVPAAVRDADSRSPKIRVSLKTSDRNVARLKRDALERADDELWASMALGDASDSPMLRHKAAVRRADAMGFTYRTAAAMASQGVDLGELLGRIAVLGQSAPGSATAEAVLGLVDEPRLTVTQAFDIYVSEIMPAALVSKSASQRTDWKKVKQRAVNNFVEQVGDVPISDITRDQARKFYQFWMGRVAPETGPATHSASSGNRDVGNMRRLYGDYHAHLGDRDRQNPFEGLSFSEKIKRKRPPFPIDWVAREFLRTEKLLGLNLEARGIMLMMIETGARPSELANLYAEVIHLDGPVPYIEIAPRTDPDDPREIKTVSSVRMIPLVGAALDVAKQFPNGFARYKNRERTLANTLNKSLKAHGLLPSPRHSAYSMRHTFEDRMKEGRVDAELRRILMGHAIDRPDYGDGGSLKLRQAELLRIALPFDARLVSAAPVRNPSAPDPD